MERESFLEAEKHPSIHLLQATCVSLFFGTAVLRKAEATYPELENLPRETQERRKITTEKQKWPGKCLALINWRLAFLLCSKFQENDRKRRGYSFSTAKNVRGTYSQWSSGPSLQQRVSSRLQIAEAPQGIWNTNLRGTTGHQFPSTELCMMLIRSFCWQKSLS